MFHILGFSTTELLLIRYLTPAQFSGGFACPCTGLQNYERGRPVKVASIQPLRFTGDRAETATGRHEPLLSSWQTQFVDSST